MIDALPEEFKFLTNSIINSGGEVHILTGGSITQKLINQLKDFGIKYTKLFSVYDYLLKTSEIMGEVQFPDGTIQKKFKNEAWDKVKGDYCRKNNISLHIDDTLVYNDNFTTPFARLWTHNNNPKQSHKDVRHLK